MARLGSSEERKRDWERENGVDTRAATARGRVDAFSGLVIRATGAKECDYSALRSISFRLSCINDTTGKSVPIPLSTTWSYSKRQESDNRERTPTCH